MTTLDDATVRIGRLERRGLLLGLSGIQTALLGAAVGIAVIAEYTTGAAGLLASLPLWGALTATALVSVGGRPIATWVPLVSIWTVRNGQRSYRARLEQFSPTSLAVPGIRRRLTVQQGLVTGAALVHDPGGSTVTASLRVSGMGFVLAEDDTQQFRVAGWGRFLASLCQQPAVARIQVLERHTAGGGKEVRRWWADNAVGQSDWATRVLADLVADSQELTDRHECLISISVRTQKPGRRGGQSDSLAAVEQQLTVLAETAQRADLFVHGWVTPPELASTLRSIHDPAGALTCATEDARLLVGPMAVEEHWASLRTDSADHAVYWIQEWPRSEVHAGFLQPLLLAPGARRTLSLTAEPLSAAKAIKDIRRAKVEQIADAAQRARMGQVEDETSRAEVADLHRREQELVAGHGDLRFIGLLTVSAPTAKELDAACAATEAAAAQALCEIRKLVGQQASAFAAAALPLARSIS